MQANYVKFADRMIKRYEGGYCWDKADPGGPTNFGITCYDLAENRGQKMTSMSTWAPIVKAMKLDEAEDIYARKYAAKLKFNQLRSGVDTVIMDYGVNSGIGRPIVVARRLVGVPGSGSVMDDALVAAINKIDPNQFIDAMCSERLRFMHAIRGGSAWATFGGGWQSRVDDLRRYSKAIAPNNAAVVIPEAPDLSKVSTPKATHAPKTAGGTISTTTVGSAGTALAAGIPWYGVLGTVVAVLGLGAAYEIYEINKANRLNNVVYA